MPGHDLSILSSQRHLVWDLLRDTDPYYLNHQVLLVDFSTVEAFRRRLEAEGEDKPSYVATVLFAMARVLPKHPVFNAYLREFPFTRVARYRGVDIAYTVEKETAGGESVLSVTILKDCEGITLAEFLARFRAQKEARLEELEYYGVLRFFLRLPRVLRMSLFRLFCKPFPATMRKIAGTVAFTSVGSHGVDVTTPLSPKTLTVSLGAVKERPVVKAGEVTAAPSAYVTLTYDHRVADGGECARMGEDLRRFLEEDIIREADSCSKN